VFYYIKYLLILIILQVSFTILLSSCAKETSSDSSSTSSTDTSDDDDTTTTDNSTTDNSTTDNSTTETTAPTVSSVSPTDNTTYNSPASTIAVTFSEAMSTSSITTNTSDTTCSGSFQLSTDNFTTCIKMSATPEATNSDKTFTATPSDNLSGGANYKLQITTSATDTSSNALASAQTSNGFTTTPSGSGTIKGSVKMDNGTAISGVSVNYAIYGSTVDNATSDSSGDFSKSLDGLGIYTLTYSKTGYIDATQTGTLSTDNQTLVVATLTQLSSGCSAGTVAGTIKNAVSGSVVSDVSLSVRSGMNVTSGTIVSTATTDGSGNYTLSSMSAGWYTIQASKSGYISANFNVKACGNVSDQNANISATLSSGSMRIVLTWTGTEDLDSHLEIPCTSGTCSGSNSADKSHLFFGTNQSIAISYSGISTSDYHIYTDIVSTGDNVTLDQDNLNGTGTAAKTGPETITISKIRSGTYRYHVHNFDDSGDNTTDIAVSGALVQVFYNDTTTTFNVRNNTAGDLWTVFDFDNSSGFTTIDTMGSEANPNAVDDH
jgi:hypothetical protein